VELIEEQRAFAQQRRHRIFPYFGKSVSAAFTRTVRQAGDR
jgi:hypothetical protein